MKIDSPEWEIDRFRWAAQTIEEWIRAWGKEKAEAMVKDLLNTSFQSGASKRAFMAAWGR